MLVLLLTFSIPLGQAALAHASGESSPADATSQGAPSAHGTAPRGPRVSLSGRFRIFHRDDFADPSKDVFDDQLVTSDGTVLSLHGSGLSHVEPGSTISVDGQVAGNDLYVGGAAGTQVTITRSAAAQDSVGPMKVAVILADFSSSTTSLDPAPLRALFEGSPGADVVSYFAESSYGKLQLAPSFFGPYRLAESAQPGCRGFDPQELLQLANHDVDYTKFSRLVFVLNCSGYGASATSSSQISTPDGTITAAQIVEDASSSTSLYTHVHELSHTLGGFNKHAGIDICLPDVFTPPTRFDQGCDVSEYGDPFDVLGGGKYHRVSQLDPYHKAVAGWLTASQFPTVTASGTFTLAPYEAPGSGTVALNIPRGSTGTAFTVEYRQPTGFDSWIGTDCAACDTDQGASIRLAGLNVAGTGGGSDTQLLDDTPGTIVDPATYYPVDDVLDGALLPGATFTDPETGIAIRTVSAGPSGLTVQVSVPAQSCTRSAPGVSAPGPSSQTASAGQTRVYTLTLTNRDSSGCAANTFRFFPSATNSDLSVVATPDYVVLPPGGSTSVNVAVTSTPSTVDGTYDYPSGLGRFFSNSMGNYVSTVPGVSYRVSSPSDSTAPSAPSAPTATALGSATVGVSWSAAADDHGVAGYLIQRGDSVFTTPTTWFLDTGLAPGTRYSYSITAFDHKDNRSSPVTVSVTTPAHTDSTAPTQPVVSASATDRTIRLSWSGARDDVGVAYYRIVPCITTCWLPASTTSITATALPTRTEYDIQVIAVDGDGNFTSPLPYPISTGVLGDAPPSRPGLLYSPSGTAGGTDLSWGASTDDRGAVSYDVYRNNRRVARVSAPSFHDPVGGNHEYYVQAVDGDGSVSAPSPRVWFLGPTLASGDDAPPSASVDAPAAGATVSGTTTVPTSSSDNVGVTKVELYVDGTLAGTSSSGSATFPWDTTNLPDGTHWLYARAYDAARNYGTTEVTSVRVDNGQGSQADTTPPTVSITSPADGSTASGPVNVTASASDDVGVDRVEFSVDGSVQDTATTTPYGFSWDPSGAAAGPHTVTATAFDAAGNSSASSVTVSVDAGGDGDTLPPTPPADLAAAIGNSVDLSWEPSTDNAQVAGYSIVRDGTEIAETPDTSYADEDVTQGTTYDYQVVALDEAGNRSAPSNTATITVPALDGGTPTAPGRVAAVPLRGGRVALAWTVGHDDQGVAGYDVYRNGVKIASTRNRTFVDSGVSGLLSYRIRTRDASGNVSAGSLPARTRMPAGSGIRRLVGMVVAQGAPLSDVRVRATVRGVRKLWTTVALGTFRVRYMPAGLYRLTFSHRGYAPVALTVRVAPTGISGFRVVMTPA
jgi:chitodextrinase